MRRQELITIGAAILILTLLQMVQNGRPFQAYLTHPFLPVELSVARGVKWLEQRLVIASYWWGGAARAAQIEVEYMKLQAQLSELTTLRDENERLKRQLTSGAPLPTARLITAPIVAYPYHLIAVGSNQGARLGDLVFANQILLGQLSEVNPNSSQVRLLTSADSPTLIVTTDSGVTGIIKAKGEQLFLTAIPFDQALIKGERVRTVGQAGIDPGLLLGLVGEERTAPTESSKSYLVEPGISFATSELVYLK